MRPKTIVAFEIEFLVTSVLSLIWEFCLQAPPFLDQATLVYFYVSSTIAAVIMALLALLVSRRRSTVAKWILLVFVGFGILSAIVSVRLVNNNAAPYGSSQIVIYKVVIQLLYAAGLALTFTPSARDWLNSKKKALAN